MVPFPPALPPTYRVSPTCGRTCPEKHYFSGTSSWTGRTGPRRRSDAAVPGPEWSTTLTSGPRPRVERHGPEGRTTLSHYQEWGCPDKTSTPSHPVCTDQPIYHREPSSFRAPTGSPSPTSSPRSVFSSPGPETLPFQAHPTTRDKSRVGVDPGRSRTPQVDTVLRPIPSNLG